MDKYSIRILIYYIHIQLEKKDASITTDNPATLIIMTATLLNQLLVLITLQNNNKSKDNNNKIYEK